VRSLFSCTPGRKESCSAQAASKLVDRAQDFRWTVACCRCTRKVSFSHHPYENGGNVGFTVPVYDGRGKFLLDKYWVKKYDGTVRPGCTVLPLFSIRKGPAPKTGQWFGFSRSMSAVYFNILAVIVIAEPSDPFCLNTKPDYGSARGVVELPRLPEPYLENILSKKIGCGREIA
jgi:hypothetical protein